MATTSVEGRREQLRQAMMDGYTDRTPTMIGILGVSERQARRILKAGYVKSRKVGNRVLIHHGSLLRYAGML